MHLARFVGSLAVWSALLAVGCETQFEMAPDALGGAGVGATPTPGVGTGTGGVGGGSLGSGSAGASTTPGEGGTSALPESGSTAPAPQGGSSAMQMQAGASGAMVEDPGTEPVVEVQSCPATSSLTPGETTEMIEVSGIMRRFILHVPASYTGQTPVPLVLDFHGILMSSSLQRAFSGYAELSESEGFIVAFPEGTDTAFNVGICCTSSGAVDDIGFARAIVEQLSQRGCIDHKRVHSVGYSMGGGMSMHLACNAADVFASIATSAFDLMPDEDWPCAPSRPIAMISFRSTGDPIVPYAGAVDTIPPNGTATLVTFIGAESNFAKWAALDGCTDAPTDLGGGCQTRTQCSAGVEVSLCTRQGGGHDYMDAAAGWAFLKRHPMP